MASYDLTAIMDALQGYQQREVRQPNNRAVEQYLLSKGVPNLIAQSNSMNELCYWTEKELDEVFHNLDVPHGTSLDKLISFRARHEQHGNVPAANFVKPTVKDIEESVAKMGALCVDRSGQFCTNPKEGFVALSHVWSQGLGADDDNRGLHRDLLQQVFDKVEPLGIKWVWTDSLAIPGGKRALDLLEEELKGALINAMANIYREARLVLVFDALCLRLNSTDPVQVAIMLSLGTWLTRMWTYQEIKLAKMAVIVTKKGVISFSAICRSLKDMAITEAGREWEGDASGKYPSIAKTFLRLQRNDELGISLPDVAIACGCREAWDKLDYARAIFPTLGVEWKPHYSTDQAMRKVYSFQQRHASRLVLYHGPPRASYPGWAPAVFNGLKDCKISTPGIWKTRGLQRSWLTTRVKFIFEREPDRFYLALESDSMEQAQSVAIISEQTLEQSPESVLLFETAVREGNAYLLTDERLDTRNRHWSIVGLLVEQFTIADNREAWVCLTVAVGQTQAHYKAERHDWLLLHENPVSKDLDSGKGLSLINYQLEHTILPDPMASFEDFPLHQAAQQDSEEWCKALVGVFDVNTVDSRGWTPLHVAAASDSRAAIAVLIEAKADKDVFNSAGNSPLILAIDNLHIDAILLLCESGANVDACSDKEGLGSPLTTAIRKGHLEIISLLLAFGADASVVDAAGWAPLHTAVTGDVNEEIVNALLSAGADPNTPSQGVLLPLAVTARDSNTAMTKKLLENKADPNLRIKGVNPPLYYAIASGSLETVVALLSGGAFVDIRFNDSWTPMMLAAKEGDHEIGKALRAKEAGLDDKDTTGLTPLHIAAMNGSRVFYKWLLEAGADISARDKQGRTAVQVVKGFEVLTQT